MQKLSFTVSKSHQEFIEAQVAQDGHRSVSAYFDALLRAERKRKAEEKLLTLVREAEASGPATPMTKGDWESIRREVATRLARKKKKVKLRR